MGVAFFYQLTESSLAQTLPTLLGKALDAGWSVEVRGSNRSTLEALDKSLWLGAEDAFLAHGLSGGPHDADQPILLTDTATPFNDRNCLVAIDAAPVDMAELDSNDRVMVVFDGADGTSLQDARNKWRDWTKGGCEAQYWAQDFGKWVKKAESGKA